MKKILVLALALLTLASCGGPELLSIYPAYMGAPVTSTHHEFKQEDFLVIAAYDNGVDEQVEDFTFEVEGMEAGYYVVNISFGGEENPVYVPIEAAIYPSDFEK